MRHLLIPTLALLLLAGPIEAADRFAYAGASLGYSYQNYSGTICPHCDGGVNNYTVHDHDLGSKIFAGYRFSPNYGIEAGHIDFGKSKIEGAIGGNPFTETFRDKADYLAAVLGARIDEKWLGDVRLGAAHWKDEGNCGTNCTLSSKDKSFYWGIGFQFNPIEHVGLRLDYDSVLNMGKYSEGTPDAAGNLFSLGIVGSF